MAFKICSKGSCGITITDLNEENYQVESILTSTGSIYYTFEQSASVNVLSSITYEDEKTIQVSEITTHYISVDDQTGQKSYVTDESTFDFPIDGLFEITHIILPTFEYVFDHFASLLTYFPNGVYFTTQGKLYKYVGFDPQAANPINVEEVTLEELLEVNTEKTTIIKESKNTFSLCHLQECYYNLVKRLLHALCGIGGCDATSKYAQDIFNRDLIWMAINAIRYAIEQGQYYEAQRLLEGIKGCGNICSEFDTNKTNNVVGCGCHH